MKISVIMAVFNGSKWLNTQLESIVNNSIKPDQIVFVDDASSDNSVEILKDFKNKYENINIIIEENINNIGYSLAFRKAALLADNEVVFFCDQDDEWLPNKIETCISVFKNNPEVGLVYSDGFITDSDLNITSETIFSTRNKAHLDIGKKRNPFEVLANPDIKGCSICVKKDIVQLAYQNINPETFNYWGFDHWIALNAYLFSKISVIKQPLFKYRIHQNNTSGNIKLNPLSFNSILKFYRMAKDQGVDFYLHRYNILDEFVSDSKNVMDEEFAIALKYFKNISHKRFKMSNKHFFARFFTATSILFDGYYHKYYNGFFTWFRDVVFRNSK